jgi:hypothetical protein
MRSVRSISPTRENSLHARSRISTGTCTRLACHAKQLLLPRRRRTLTTFRRVRDAAAPGHAQSHRRRRRHYCSSGSPATQSLTAAISPGSGGGAAEPRPSGARGLAARRAKQHAAECVPRGRVRLGSSSASDCRSEREGSVVSALEFDQLERSALRGCEIVEGPRRLGVPPSSALASQGVSRQRCSGRMYVQWPGAIGATRWIGGAPVPG